MNRCKLWLSFGAAVLVGWSALQAFPPAESPVPPTITMEQIVAGEAELLDLAWPINRETQYWPGENYQPFELKTIATLEKNGVLSKSFSMPEHLGTHIDAPNHFEADQISVAEIAPQRLFAAGVVIDVSVQCSLDADFQLQVRDINDWETQHGRIPDHAVVLLNTGWGRFWNNPARFRNADVQGKFHFPGYSAEAAKFLVEKRQIRGLGTDTLSIDPGMSRDFAVHHIVNRATRYGLENIAHLDQLPARGFYLVIAPIKIEQGTGGPTRIFAILPRAKPLG